VDQAARTGRPRQKLTVRLRIAFVTAAVLLRAAAFACAQDQPAASDKDNDNDCDGGTLQLLECIDGKTRPWDKRLNAAYQQALKDARPEQRDQLRSAQRAWVLHRDANCDYYSLGEGSIARVEAADCVFRMTKSRAQELENGSGLN
jgi:uncharacterized protein YecT (DUF1311 family)